MKMRITVIIVKSKRTNIKHEIIGEVLSETDDYWELLIYLVGRRNLETKEIINGVANKIPHHIIKIRKKDK